MFKFIKQIFVSTLMFFGSLSSVKYSIIDLTEEYEEVSSGIKSEIKKLNGGKELFYEKNMQELELMQMVIYL